MKTTSNSNRIVSKKILLIGGILFLLCVGMIPQSRAQNTFLPPLFNIFGVPAPFTFPILAPVSALPLRAAAFPPSNFTPLTVTVPQVTAAGLTVTSLVPSLAPPPTPTVTIILNLTAATPVPTTFVAPFPLTPTVVPVLPVVTTTVTLPTAAPTLTSLIALNLGGGIPGITGGGGILTTLPPPTPTTALPVVQVPTAAIPLTIPVI